MLVMKPFASLRINLNKVESSDQGSFVRLISIVSIPQNDESQETKNSVQSHYDRPLSVTYGTPSKNNLSHLHPRGYNRITVQ